MINNKFEIGDIVYIGTKELKIGVVNSICCKKEISYQNKNIEYGIIDFNDNEVFFQEHLLSKEMPESIACERENRKLI